MGNLFENAKYGTIYKTRSGKKALFIDRAGKHNVYCMLIEGNDDYSYVDKYGHENPDNAENPDDIVSLYEVIDEEYLEQLAATEFPYEYETSLYAQDEIDYKNELRNAFKLGFKKANPNITVIRRETGNKKNIFENAVFGTPYQTMDGKYAIFLAKHEDHISYVIKGETYDEAIYICDYEGKGLCTGEQVLKPLLDHAELLRIENDWVNNVYNDSEFGPFKSFDAGLKEGLRICKLIINED